MRRWRLWYIALAVMTALAITTQLSQTSNEADGGLFLEDSDGTVTTGLADDDPSADINGSFLVFSGLLFVVLLAPLGFLALSAGPFDYLKALDRWPA